MVLVVRNPPANAGERHRFNPWVGKILWSSKWQPTPVFLPGKLHGHRSLVGYDPWGLNKSNTTDHAHTHIIDICVCVYTHTFSHTHIYIFGDLVIY